MKNFFLRPLRDTQLRAFRKETESLALGCVVRETLEVSTAAKVVESLLHLADQLGQPNRDERAVIDLMDDYARKLGARIEVRGGEGKGKLVIHRDWNRIDED